LKKNLGFNSSNTLRTDFQLILLPTKDKKQVQVALAFQELAIHSFDYPGTKKQCKTANSKEKKHSFKPKWSFFETFDIVRELCKDKQLDGKS
jgi:hypothetical protein